MSTINEIPADVADAIEAGDSPAHAFRVAERKTIEEVAGDAGLDPYRVAEIEAGATPDLDELVAVGEALAVAPDLLLSETSALDDDGIPPADA